MKNQRTFDLVIMAMFLTIIIILTFTPLGYPPIPFLPIGPTIIHIPVLVACFYFGLSRGTLTGVMFGVSSWIVAMTRGATPIDWVFRNPLVSILPRILFAVVAVYIYQFASKRMNNKLAMGLSAGLSTLLHTFLVLFPLALFGRSAIINYLELADQSSIDIFMMLIGANILTNSVPEVVLAILIVPPIIIALQNLEKRTPQINTDFDE